MHEKFVNLRKMIIPTMSILIITSQLCGCSSINSKEAMELIRNNESIEIEVPEPVNVEQGTEISYEWTELAELTTYPEFRALFEDKFDIRVKEDGTKLGVAYIGLDGYHTNNSTLHYAFMNKKFYDLFNFKETMKPLIEEIKTVYTDIDTDEEAQAAILNAYFNILSDSTPNYFNGESLLTRGDFLAGLYRVNNPVQEISNTKEFINLVGEEENTVFAEQIADYSYLDIESKSLNKDTFNGTITRAEAIYSLVSYYYPEELSSLQLTGKETIYNDIKNGGNLSEKLGFVTYDKKTDTYSKVDYWKSYEISCCLNNVELGVNEDIYKAFVIAYNHNLINSEESNYDCGLTKADFINLIINIYTDKVVSKQYINDSLEGKFESVSLNRGDTTDTENTSNEESTNGGSKDIVEEVKADNAGIEKYYTKDENGSLVLTPEFVAILQETTLYRGATVEQITKDLEENIGLLDELDNEDTEAGLNNFLETIEILGSISPLVPQDSSSTTTAKSNDNTTTTNTEASNSNTTSSSSSNTSSSSGSLPSGWIPDDQLPPANESEGNSSGFQDVTREDSGTGPLTSAYDIQ